jgi:diphosphomevalonate decarboxylase
MANIVTAVGPSNRALINHWGKDPTTNRPDSASLSVTLDMKDLEGRLLRTKTSVAFSDTFSKDRLYIDGKLVDLTTVESMERFRPVDGLREMAGVRDRVLVVSQNSFPSAAGIASSASGVATLVMATSRALDLNLDAKELSKIARMGSGSASRSLFGGVVLWERGVNPDGSDSFARQVFTSEYWPELVDVIVVVSSERKPISSTEGMMLSRNTSPLYKARLEYVPGAIDGVLSDFAARNFDSLAARLMKESDNLHEVMRTTVPSIVYLTPKSHQIIDGVVALNEAAGRNIAAYTVGAGPNVHIITEQYNLAVVHAMLDKLDVNGAGFSVRIGGSGPIVVDDSHLIDPDTLNPR